MPRLKRYVGYVTQDDVFFAKLTVRQTLMFTADVRLPRSIGHAERVARVERLIKCLGLDKCADTIVGDDFDRGISGGERKRLNIANELIHEPSLFLADECTSGLDSSSALNVLNVLEGLCNDGRTVIVTIHQPSSRMFSMFGKILLLAAGRVAYFGKPDGIVRHFSQVLDYPFPAAAYNPADYALELVIDEQKQGRIIDAWRKVEQSKASGNMNGINTNVGDENNVENDEHVQGNIATARNVQIYDGTPPSNHAQRVARAVTKRAGQVADLFLRGEGEEHIGRNGMMQQQYKYHTSWWDQTTALMKRSKRQKQGLLLRGTTITYVIVLTMLAVIIWVRTPVTEANIEDRLGLLNYQTVSWGFFGVYASVYAFPAERVVLQKDRSNGVYRLSAYYVAKSLVELPADMLYPAFSVMVIYFPTGMNPDGRAFVLNVVVLVLHTLIGHSIGLFVSCALMNVQQAQVAGSLWALGSLLTAGYLIDPSNIPSVVQFTRYLSFLRVS